jgi:hypothetical protein
LNAFILTIVVSAACGFVGGILARQFDRAKP